MSESDDQYGTLKPVAKPARGRPVIRPIEPSSLVPEVPIKGKVPSSRVVESAPAEPEEYSGILVPDEVLPEPIPSKRDAILPASRPSPTAPPRRATAVGRLCQLGDDARALLDEKQLVLPFLYRLMNQRLYHDAVRFLAQALPVRAGVEWACECAEGALDADQSAAALWAAREWVATPNEGNRRACGIVARSAGYGTAAGSAALAAFFSGGSIAAADRPAAAPREGVAGQAIGNAVLLTALSSAPERAPERLLQFLKKGISDLVSLGQVSSTGVQE